jgi:hypothetical protein
MSDGLRRAALMLHAMPRADRAWALRSLEPCERTSIEPLLAEIDALGLEPDPSLIEAALSDERVRLVTPPVSTAQSDASPPGMADTDPAEIALVLEHEAPRTIAVILAAFDAARASSILDALDDALGDRIVSALRVGAEGNGHGVGDETRQALLRALQARLDARWHASQNASERVLQHGRAACDPAGPRMDGGPHDTRTGLSGLRASMSAFARRLGRSRALKIVQGSR